MSSGDEKQRFAIVALHDVTPFHLPRLRRAEALLSQLGVQRAAYLFIPNYHHISPAVEDREFLAWCQAPRSYAVEWFLHGYYHLQDLGRMPLLGAFDRLRLKLITGGEGEFLPLPLPEQRSRIANGIAMFEACLGHRPSGFVAPAFLFRPELLALLADCGFRYSEDHHQIFHLDPLRQRRAPILTWATRTLVRKYGSIVVAPLLMKQWANEQVLRLAVHPYDFDHPETVASISSIFSQALRERRQILPADLEFDAA